MAEDRLRDCPDCDATISVRAFECPHCGAPLRVRPSPPRQGEGLFLQTMNAGCLVTLVVLVVGFVLALLVFDPAGKFQ